LSDTWPGGKAEAALRREKWAVSVARALVAVWQRESLHSGREGGSDFGRMIMATLARIEMALHHRDASRRVPEWAPRGLVLLALSIARGLPDTPQGRDQSLALLELILRLRRSHPGAVRALAHMDAMETLLAQAPDPLDDQRADELAAFLEGWRALERGESLALPPPDGCSPGQEHSLGVAR
jgi:hypothetical protein